MIREESLSLPATNSVGAVSNAVDNFQNQFSTDALSPEEFFFFFFNRLDYVFKDGNWLGNLFTFGASGRAREEMWQKMYDYNLQKYFKDYDVYLANTEIQRRVKDALAAGINPLFALGQRGAGDASGGLASNSSYLKQNNTMSSILKMMMVLFGIAKFLG